MTCFVYSLALLFLVLILSEAKTSTDPLQGAHSVCADVCASSEAHVELDLSEPRIDRDNERVHINLHHTGSGRCREPALLQIPLQTIGKHGIIKFDLSFGPVLHNFSIDIGFTNDTKRNLNIFNQEISIEYHSNNYHLAEQSVTLLEPGEDLTIYLSTEWIHIENKQRKDQKLTIHFNETNFFFPNQTNSHSDIFIGLNRNLNGKQTGIGLCSANLTFIECLAEAQSALDIDVNNKTFEQRDLENINWISHLTYLDPNDQTRECTAQGVIRLTFDPLGSRRIARFDLTMGSQVQGFTFNIGDSSTNNGYGGDGGTTSNSAEIHSNDNRFYVWANTKICGDTLLLKIDYNVIEPRDIITIFVSDERVELTNHRSYHQTLRSPYLFALNQQNVTCNCFDSLCYPGVQPDHDIYFGLNRVIGGTYRPGTGVCNANINWLQCKKIDVSPRITYTPIATTTSSTTEMTPSIKVEETTMVSTSSESIETTTYSFEHTDEMIISITSIPSMEKSNHSNEDYSSSTFASLSTTGSDLEETTSVRENEEAEEKEEITTSEPNFNYTTTTQRFDEEESTVSTDELTTISTLNNQSRLIELLTNSSQYLTTEYFNSTIMETTSTLSSTSSSSSSSSTTTTTTTMTMETKSAHFNPCTIENLRGNFVYHEYPLDNRKFIFCDSEGKMNIIACSPNYIWSQREQSCILPV